MPWSRWQDVPLFCRYNVDEDAAATDKGRDPILASVNPHADGQGRLFEVSSDGKMSAHVTDVLTTRADGVFCAPWVIKTRGGGDAAKAASKKRKAGEAVKLPKVTEADKENLLDDRCADGETLDIDVAASPNGSMTLELFVKWCDHFVTKCIDTEKQGPGTRALDGGMRATAVLLRRPCGQPRAARARGHSVGTARVGAQRAPGHSARGGTARAACVGRARVGSVCARPRARP